jgi:predicted nucleic acid-binding protein
VILVDTSVLSLAFRRRIKFDSEPPLVLKFRHLVEQDQSVAVPGIALQELLSGVRTEAEFERLQYLMEGFPIILAASNHHVDAAKILNKCRQTGITVSTIDCLIAALAIETESQLLANDQDFVLIASCCTLQLLKF